MNNMLVYAVAFAKLCHADRSNVMNLYRTINCYDQNTLPI